MYFTIFCRSIALKGPGVVVRAVEELLDVVARHVGEPVDAALLVEVEGRRRVLDRQELQLQVGHGRGVPVVGVLLEKDVLLHLPLLHPEGAVPDEVLRARPLLAVLLHGGAMDGEVGEEAGEVEEVGSRRLERDHESAVVLGLHADLVQRHVVLLPGRLDGLLQKGRDGGILLVAEELLEDGRVAFLHLLEEALRVLGPLFGPGAFPALQGAVGGRAVVVGLAVLEIGRDLLDVFRGERGVEHALPRPLEIPGRDGVAVGPLRGAEVESVDRAIGAQLPALRDAGLGAEILGVVDGQAFEERDRDVILGLAFFEGGIERLGLGAVVDDEGIGVVGAASAAGAGEGEERGGEQEPRNALQHAPILGRRRGWSQRARPSACCPGWACP